MGHTFALSGASHLLPIIGDPVAQVKSPAGLTQRLQENGRDVICVPMHVAPAHFAASVSALRATRNVDGFIATVPHKFAAYSYCASASERAHLLGAVNVMRRNPDLSWHGDMLDGCGFVDGMQAAGCQPQGARTLLVGAGGAGSAIGLALLDAGVAQLAIHDDDAQRRDALRSRLETRFSGRTCDGSRDPAGFDLVVNATPCGMRTGDPLPVEVARITRDMFVADVITLPALTPLLAAAHQAGCKTQTGNGMFDAVARLMVGFLLEGGALAQ